MNLSKLLKGKQVAEELSGEGGLGEQKMKTSYPRSARGKSVGHWPSK